MFSCGREVCANVYDVCVCQCVRVCVLSYYQDPYLIAHNAILAHASAVKVYRDKFMPAQKGTIGELAQQFVQSKVPC